MQVTITAVFPNYAMAKNAADCMSVVTDSMSMQVSMEQYPTDALNGLRNVLGAAHTPSQLLDVCPTAQHTDSEVTVIRLICQEELSTFAIKELSALGAEKVTVSMQS